MKHLLANIGLLFTFNTLCFSQDSVENKKFLFVNGVQLEKPNYNFKWSFHINDIPTEKFINYQVDKMTMKTWTLIKFDSVLFNQFLFKRVIVKATKRKSDDKFNMREFIGIVDFETLEKMATYFDYDWKGWVFYPKQNPLYKLRLYKDKNEGAIIIDRF